MQKLFVALDGDEAPEAIRAALGDGPVPFATLRERLGVEADALAETLVRASTRGGGVLRRAVAGGAGRRVSGRGRAGWRGAGAARRGGDDAAQSGRADHGRADGALLGLLDGTRDREAILEAFPGALDAPSLDAALAKFAELGLLHA